jgi:L-lactate dehydrogenase
MEMKVGIIGAGMVGSTTAYALIMRGVGREIIHYADLAGSKVVVISAGVSREPGETRLELLIRNAAVFRTVIPQVLEYAPNAILVVATNPVDIMTHLAAQYANELGVSSSRVIGTGTTLDTARFRSLLGQHLEIDPTHVHAYVLGEHGDSEVVPFSPVTIGNIPLEEFCDQWEICLDDEGKTKMDLQVRNAAHEIIEGKGATYYGVGSAIAKIIEVILRNQRAILTVCTLMEEVAGIKDVTLSLPHLVGGEGIIKSLNVPLTKDEATQLQNSAMVIKDAIDHLA